MRRAPTHHLHLDRSSRGALPLLRSLNITLPVTSPHPADRVCSAALAVGSCNVPFGCRRVSSGHQPYLAIEDGWRHQEAIDALCAAAGWAKLSGEP
jgi:hypothetical protein